MSTTDQQPGAPTATADAPYLGADIAELFAMTPLHRNLGVAIERAPGGVRIAGSVDEAWARADGMPFLHGGVLATLLDSACTFALIAETGRLWATVDMRVDYLRPASLEGVEVVATVLRAGGSIGRTQAELRDASGKVCATAVGTFAAERSG